MHAIHTDQAPIPNGHYEQAISHQGLLFVSLQLPIDPVLGPLKLYANDPESIQKQTHQVFRNVAAIVHAGGSSVQQILKMTLYVSAIEHWPAINAHYEEFFGDSKPARGVIPTGKLHLGFDVAAECIAAVSEQVLPNVASSLPA